VEPRLRFSWAEKAFLFVSLAIHGLSVWFNIRGDLPIHVPKWFDITFGIPSPTSGTGRSIMAINRGDFGDAFIFNPVGALAGIYMAIFPVYLAISAKTRKMLVLSHLANRIVLVVSLSTMFVAWARASER
jgi:hypothetical protein